MELAWIEDHFLPENLRKKREEKKKNVCRQYFVKNKIRKFIMAKELQQLTPKKSDYIFAI